MPTFPSWETAAKRRDKLAKKLAQGTLLLLLVAYLGVVAWLTPKLFHDLLGLYGLYVLDYLVTAVAVAVAAMCLAGLVWLVVDTEKRRVGSSYAAPHQVLQEASALASQTALRKVV